MQAEHRRVLTALRQARGRGARDVRVALDLDGVAQKQSLAHDQPKTFAIQRKGVCTQGALSKKVFPPSFDESATHLAYEE